jgi:hypothetical protein
MKMHLSWPDIAAPASSMSNIVVPNATKYLAVLLIWPLIEDGIDPVVGLRSKKFLTRTRQEPTTKQSRRRRRHTKERRWTTTTLATKWSKILQPIKLWTWSIQKVTSTPHTTFNFNNLNIYFFISTAESISSEESASLVRGGRQMEFEYNCVICRKTFRDYRDFQVHLASHLIPEKHSSPFADFARGMTSSSWSHSISPNTSTPLMSPLSSSSSHGSI